MTAWHRLKSKVYRRCGIGAVRYFSNDCKLIYCHHLRPWFRRDDNIVVFRGIAAPEWPPLCHDPFDPKAWRFGSIPGRPWVPFNKKKAG
jgi:hypothetical protein